MNKNKKLSDLTVKEFEELLNNIISKAKLYCPQTQPYWYFPNHVGDYPSIYMNDNVKVTYSTHTEAMNDRD